MRFSEGFETGISKEKIIGVVGFLTLNYHALRN